MNILINQEKKQCPPHGSIKNVNCFPVFALLRAKLIYVDVMYATEQFLAVTCLRGRRKKTFVPSTAPDVSAASSPAPSPSRKLRV